MQPISQINNRQISSSQDHCKCPVCKHQEDPKLFQRKNITNIYLYKHLKKRQGPPTKKDNIIKDLSQKAKYIQKKQDNDKRIESDNKNNATPIKGKQDRARQTPNSLLGLEYHQVSHSQRLRSEFLIQLAQNGKREDRDPRLRMKMKSNYELGIQRLAQISENPQNIKIVRNHSSSNHSSNHHQASPPCFGIKGAHNHEHEAN